MTKKRPSPAQRAEAKRVLAEIIAAEPWADAAWPVRVHLTPWSSYRGAEVYWTASVSSQQVSDVLKDTSMFCFQTEAQSTFGAPRVAKRLQAAINGFWPQGIRRLEINLPRVSAHEAIAAEIAAARWDASPAAGAA